MTAARALVLLPGTSEPASWAPVEAGLSGLQVLTPSLDALTASGPFALEGSAGAVLDTLDDAGIASTAVCGVGVGALVALQLAADHPDRVDHLILVTRQVRLSPLLLSLPAVVLRLLPVSAVRRLGADPATLLALLDQVRPVDATPLAKRVTAPTLVLCGARDPLNRRASQALTQSLPQGRLQLLAKAGPSWLTDNPQLLAQALTTFLRAG